MHCICGCVVGLSELHEASCVLWLVSKTVCHTLTLLYYVNLIITAKLPHVKCISFVLCKTLFDFITWWSDPLGNFQKLLFSVCSTPDSPKLKKNYFGEENEPFSTAERSERVENFLFHATREYTEAGIEQAAVAMQCLGANSPRTAQARGAWIGHVSAAHSRHVSAARRRPASI